MTATNRPGSPPPSRRPRRNERAIYPDFRICDELEPCPTCGVAAWWRRHGDDDLSCFFCAPPKSEHGIEVVLSSADPEVPDLGGLLAELGRPATVAALGRAAQHEPTVVDDVAALMERATLAAGAGDQAAYEEVAAEMLVLIRQVRQRYSRRQE